MPRADSPYNTDWKKVRAIVLRANPSCRLCGKRATMVDHIDPVKARADRRLDIANLQALCWGCHAKVTQAYDIGYVPRGACDEAGMPLDPRHPWASAGLGRAETKRQFIRRVIDGRWKR